MEMITSTSSVNEPTQKLLPWHKPEVTRLSVSLDTEFYFGLGISGIGSDTAP